MMLSHKYKTDDSREQGRGVPRARQIRAEQLSQKSSWNNKYLRLYLSQSLSEECVSPS